MNSLPNSAEAVANELVEQWMPELMPIRPIVLKKELAYALTTFAAQQVQATWEEAAGMADNLGKGGHYHFPTLAEEFRRRAQEGKR